MVLADASEPGTCLVLDASSGTFVTATAEARAGGERTACILVQRHGGPGYAITCAGGPIPPSITGLAEGPSTTFARVTDAGRLERVDIGTELATDDIVGHVLPSGLLLLFCGIVPSGGGGLPGGGGAGKWLAWDDANNAPGWIASSSLRIANTVGLVAGTDGDVVGNLRALHTRYNWPTSDAALADNVGPVGWSDNGYATASSNWTFNWPDQSAAHLTVTVVADVYTQVQTRTSTYSVRKDGALVVESMSTSDDPAGGVDFAGLLSATVGNELYLELDNLSDDQRFAVYITGTLLRASP